MPSCCLTLTLVIITWVLLVPQSVDAFFKFTGSRPSNPEDDVYGVLGLPRSATQQEIKKAFRNIAKNEHPDTKSTAEEKEKATERMRQVIRAYNVLSDDAKRAEFDKYGTIAGEMGSVSSQGASSRMPPDFDAFPPELQELLKRFGFQSGPPQPILSSTPDLTLRYLQSVVLPYRGSHMTLIQFYADGYSSCSLLSKVWERFASSSPLVSSKAVNMFRVNVHSEEGDALVHKILGVTKAHLTAVPMIVAITDGSIWEMRSLQQYLSPNSQSALYQELVTFVNSFYSSFESTILNGPQSVSDIVSWFQHNGDNTVPSIKVLISGLPDVSMYVGIVAAVDDPKVKVCAVVIMQELLEFVTSYCGRRVPKTKLTELIVLLNETIIDTNTKGASGYPLWCSKLDVVYYQSHVGLSRLVNIIQGISLSDSDMVKTKYPRSLPIIRSPTAFTTTCHKYCALWLIVNCDERKLADIMTPPIWANNHRFDPFKIVAVCLDRQEKLKVLLQHALGRRMSLLHNKDALLMYAAARPDTVLLYAHPDVVRGGGLPDVEGVLSAFLESSDLLSNYPEASILSMHSGALDTAFIVEDSSFEASDLQKIIGNASRTSSVVSSRRFPLPLWKYVLWRGYEWYYSLPFSSLWLLGLLWLLSRFLFSKDRRNNNTAPEGSRERVPNATEAKRNYSSGHHSCHSGYIPFDAKRDLSPKQTAPFVLIVVVNTLERAVQLQAQQEVLQSGILNEERFAVRLVTKNSKEWLIISKWVVELKLVDNDTTKYYFVAIRVRRRMAAIRLSSGGAVSNTTERKSLHVWLSELTDGTITPSVALSAQL